LIARRKKLLISFASFFGLIIAFLTVEHFRGERALERWKAAMAKKGEDLSIDKLTPPPPMADENGMPQLLWIAGQLGSFPSELQPPAGKYAAPGKWVVITRLNEWQFRNSKRTNANWTEVGETLAASEGRVDAAIEALRSTAFNANLYYRAGINMPMNHLTRIKSLAQFLSAAALHHLHQGQNAAALEKLQALLAFANVLKDECTIISQLVRIAVMHIAFAATWQALQHDGWSDGQLAALQDSWGAYDFLSGMDRAFAMERAIIVAEYERCRSSDVPLSSMFDPSGALAPPPTPSLLSWKWVGEMFDPRERIFAPLWKFAWSKQDELHYCQSLQSALEVHRDGARTKVGAAVIKAIEHVESPPSAMYDRLRFLMSRMATGSLSGSMTRAWTAQVTADIARTAIAIKRYELREGALPRTLESLVPDFLTELPIDCMDGRPLRYCVDGASFVLYSVGVDGLDGNGDVTSTNSSLNYHTTRDLVWPQPASEIETLNWKTSRR
jgi:hypothetical protein